MTSLLQHISNMLRRVQPQDVVRTGCASMSFIRPSPHKRPQKDDGGQSTLDPKKPRDPKTNGNGGSASAKNQTSSHFGGHTHRDQSFPRRPHISSIFSNVKTVPFSYDTPSSSTQPADAVERIKSHIFFTPVPETDVDAEFDTPQQSFSSSSFKTEHLCRPASSTVEHIFVNFHVKSGWFSNELQISFPDVTPAYIVCAAADALRDFLEDRPAGVDFTSAKLHAPTLVQTGSDWNRYHYSLEQKDIWGSADPLTIQGVILDALVNRVACEFVTSTSFGSVRNYSTTYVFTHIPANAPAFVEDANIVGNVQHNVFTSGAPPQTTSNDPITVVTPSGATSIPNASAAGTSTSTGIPSTSSSSSSSSSSSTNTNTPQQQS